MATSLHPWVKRDLFLGFMWAGEAIGTTFIFMRLAIRVKCFRRLYSDDYFVIFAWICSLAASIIWQVIIGYLYDQYKLSAGTLALTPEVLRNEKTLLRGSMAYLLLWYTCIYSIKASFLLFFRRLDELCQGPRKIWWWTVTVITICSFVVTCSTTQYKCLVSDLTYIFTQCSNADALEYQHVVFTFQCVIDVVSDTLIMTIPIIMLWSVRMPLKKKIALMGLFSLTILVMATAITRVAVIPTAHTQADVSWLYFWHNLEMSVALLVASFASFRQLYVTQSQRLPSSGHTQSLKGSVSSG